MKKTLKNFIKNSNIDAQVANALATGFHPASRAAEEVARSFVDWSESK